MTKAGHLSAEQYGALISAEGPKRFKHFVSQAADKEVLWGLRDESGWVSLADDAGAPGFPIWPHPDYARDCAAGAWSGCAPERIDVHEFVADWLPDMSEQGVSIAVFPTPAMRGVWILPVELKRCLEEELEKYE